MVPSTWGWTHTAFCQVTGKDTGLSLSSQGAYSTAQEQGSWPGGAGGDPRASLRRVGASLDSCYNPNPHVSGLPKVGARSC